MSNTPFRSYKQYTHEGGIASPLIIHWPNGIANKGQLRKQPSHLIDIMTTCLEIAGIEYPKQLNGDELQAIEGRSLVPSFSNMPLNRDFIFWEHSANRALRVGDWKLVSKTGKQKTFGVIDENKWELYDLSNDPTERINLASKFPEKAKELAQKW